MRDDLSNKLIHLTKGESTDDKKNRGEALTILGKILKTKKLLGGNGFIKGGYKCVCFSEAPISKLSQIISLRDRKKFKYQPYGIIFDKAEIYSKGGRPVIYGPTSDYDQLPPSMKYRHVRFELSKKDVIDLTHEREWRIKTDAIDLSPKNVTVIVPDRRAKRVLEKKYSDDRWHYLVLSDLGVEITAL